MMTRKALSVLDNIDSTEHDLAMAIKALGRLTSTGWGKPMVWRTRVMTSYAARPLDRLALEELLDEHLPVAA